MMKHLEIKFCYQTIIKQMNNNKYKKTGYGIIGPEAVEYKLHARHTELFFLEKNEVFL